MSEWQPIAEYDVKHCMAVLVTAKNRYGAWREPISAFNDATEVWRVLGSRGGMTPLSFTPTMFMPIPERPKQT
jgi:hypothetical protein